jgi:hypothetical protein
MPQRVYAGAFAKKSSSQQRTATELQANLLGQCQFGDRAHRAARIGAADNTQVAQAQVKPGDHDFLRQPVQLRIERGTAKLFFLHQKRLVELVHKHFWRNKELEPVLLLRKHLMQRAMRLHVRLRGEVLQLAGIRHHHVGHLQHLRDAVQRQEPANRFGRRLVPMRDNRFVQRRAHHRDDRHTAQKPGNKPTRPREHRTHRLETLHNFPSPSKRHHIEHNR